MTPSIKKGLALIWLKIVIVSTFLGFLFFILFFVSFAFDFEKVVYVYLKWLTVGFGMPMMLWAFWGDKGNLDFIVEGGNISQLWQVIRHPVLPYFCKSNSKNQIEN